MTTAIVAVGVALLGSRDRLFSVMPTGTFVLLVRGGIVPAGAIEREAGARTFSRAQAESMVEASWAARLARPASDSGVGGRMAWECLHDVNGSYVATNPWPQYETALDVAQDRRAVIDRIFRESPPFHGQFGSPPKDLSTDELAAILLRWRPSSPGLVSAFLDRCDASDGRYASPAVLGALDVCAEISEETLASRLAKAQSVLARAALGGSIQAKAGPMPASVLEDVLASLRVEDEATEIITQALVTRHADRDTLRRAARNDRSPVVRKCLLIAMRDWPELPIPEWMQGACDPDPSVAATARALLVERAGELRLMVHRALTTTRTDAELGAAMQQVVCQVAGANLGALVAMVRTEADDDDRVVAIRCLDGFWRAGVRAAGDQEAMETAAASPSVIVRAEAHRALTSIVPNR